MDVRNVNAENLWMLTIAPIVKERDTERGKGRKLLCLKQNV